MTNAWTNLDVTFQRLYALIAVLALALAVNEIFDLQFFSETVLFGPSFNFLIVGLLGCVLFLVKPLRTGSWLIVVDIIFALVFLACCLYFAWLGLDIPTKGYSYAAPLPIVLMALAVWILLLEAMRRAAGLTLALVVLFFSIYPLFAGHMPGLLEGVERPWDKVALFHILSDESAMGALTNVFSHTVLGFVIFGVVVVEVGGSEFLLDLSHSLVGKTRGATAKVAVVASAFFGMISGSPIANVITTGSITIPAMKKTGYSGEFAGAVESCASTAGTFTPPIMGASAFVLASFINVPYVEVALAASVPAFLFYLGLFVQLDGHAARTGIIRPPGMEVRPTREVLKDGWFFFPTIAVLIFFLFVMRWTGEAPYVATAFMLLLVQLRKKTRFDLAKLRQVLASAATNSAIILVIMVGAGMLLGAFSLTGIAATFSRELLILAGGNIFLMLVMTALASLIMGMGMSVIACYIFLALVVAPALVSSGLNELSVHLFLLYCGMLSYITPPVALCAFAAATIANASPLKIGLTASRMGGVIYILPFFFVLNPALLFMGPPLEVAICVVSAIVGVGLMGYAIDGYMLGIGNLRMVRFGWLLRIVIFLAALALTAPYRSITLVGLVVAVAALAAAVWAVRESPQATALRSAH